MTISKRSSALLQSEPLFESWAEMTELYRARLWAADLMRTPRQLDVGHFIKAFGAFHSGSMEKLRPLFDRASSRDVWALEMARRHTQAKHPLQHVLFSMFLDARPQRQSVFGPGPWECPNPIAGHQDTMTISRVSELKSGRETIGTFECACGYAYTMSVGPSGRLRGPRFKQYGPLLDPALKRLVRAGKTLRGCARALHLHPRAVAQAASRLNLNTGWKVVPRAGPRLGVSTHPPRKSRRRLASAHLARPAQARHDWRTKDEELLSRIPSVVAEIVARTPPEQVTRLAIERVIARENYLHLRKSKLPQTTAVVNELMETVEQFQERRVRNIINEHVRLSLPLVPSRIQRAASLRTAWRPRIIELIHAAERIS